MVGSHTAAQAEALAAGLAALTLGRPGSCSLTFRERMEAEEAAFLGALLGLVLLRRLELIRLHLHERMDAEEAALLDPGCVLRVYIP